MFDYSFAIYISNGGESFVDYDITAAQAKKIKKAMDECIDFEDAPGLKTLYKNVRRAAKNKLIEDLEITRDEFDDESFEFEIDFDEVITEEFFDD